MMKTIKASYSISPSGLDKLYTFEANDDVKVGDILWTPSLDRILVISVDKEYDEKAKARFGQLVRATINKPELTAKVKRL